MFTVIAGVTIAVDGARSGNGMTFQEIIIMLYRIMPLTGLFTEPI